MPLSMTVLRCPEGVAPEGRAINSGEFHIGRGPDVDWVLPDPDRLLSKRHFAVALREGAWLIVDTSTNGTYLNTDAEAIGRTAARELHDGDRLRLGAYLIEVRVTPDQTLPAHGATAPDIAAEDENPFDDSATEATIGPPRRTPRPVAEGAPLAPLDEAQAPMAQDHPAPGSANSPRAAAEPAPNEQGPNGAAAPHAGPAEPSNPPVMAAEPPTVAPVVRQRPARSATVSASVAPIAAPGDPDTGQHAMAGAATRDSAILDAFLLGAGLTGIAPTDPEAMMEGLGEAFRAVVSGLRAVLIARATIKGEFRIEQTMIRAGGNNPLKFSIDDDDALMALLGLGRRAARTSGAKSQDTVSPGAAVAESLRDIRVHEIAVMAAMQVAVRALLGQLDPTEILAGLNKTGNSLLPARRKARAWDAFEARHADAMRALTDDFDSVFGKAFAHAYEGALDEIAMREKS